MKQYIRAIPLLLLVAGATQLPAAPAQVARYDYSLNSNETCKAGVCTGGSKGTLAVVHSFTVPASTIQGFTPDTSVTVYAAQNPIAFKLSDDSRYKRGDSSAHITKTMQLEYLSSSDAQVTAQLNWTGTHFQVTIKARLNGEAFAGKKVAGEQKSLTTDLLTRIESGKVATFEQADQVPVDFTSTASFTTTPQGDSRTKFLNVVKTIEAAE